MRRDVSTAARGAVLAAVLALALPAPAAWACMPRLMPALDPREATVPPGGMLRVSADTVDTRTGRHAPCPAWGSLPPSPVPSTPVQTVSPTPLVSLPPVPSISVPPVSLPPMVPVAYAAPARRVVTLTLQPFHQRTPERAIGSAVAAAPVPYQEGLYRHRFTTTVTIPADVPTGRYFLFASERNGVVFGMAELTVAGTLADTGSPAAGLTGLGVLSLVTGGLVLEIGRRARHATR